LKFNEESAHDGKQYGEMVQSAKGYGFIQPKGGGKDVFIRISGRESRPFHPQ
jgi:cold shock CspA family protein